MAYENFPKWLSSFSLSVLDQNKIPLFNQYENSLDEIVFQEGNGGVVGSIVEVKNVKYKIDEFHFYFYKDNDTDKASAELHIIVSEIAD